MAATQETSETHKEGKEEGHNAEPGRTRGQNHCECDPCIWSSCEKGCGHSGQRKAGPSIFSGSCASICGGFISGSQCQDNSCRGS